MTAKQEIEDFLQSGKSGILTSLNKPALIRAAEKLFSFDELSWPIWVTERSGQTFLINRQIVGKNHEDRSMVEGR